MGDLTSITDSSISLPSLDEVLRVALLQDYNTRLVVVSTAALGLAAGLIGTFLYLRKRALVGDALSHATLPGIALAFMVMVALGGSGKTLAGLLAGAAVFGLLGVGCVLLIRGLTRLKDDAALGIVLSVFFGFGIALLGLVQNMAEGSAAGLQSFIYGKTASMVRSDLILIAGCALVIALACAALYKELAVLCFDEQFAGAQGLSVTGLDIVLMTLVTAITVIGLQAVGLILVIALLIIPPAACRFWTERLGRMLAGSAALGAASCWIGASLSALVPRLPAGAVIVVVAAAAFVVSLLGGTARGVIPGLLRRLALSRTIGHQHLLRAVYELTENGPGGVLRPGGVTRDRLLAMRSWSPRRVGRLLGWARRRGLIEPAGSGAWRLTEAGLGEATRVARNHRLWEIYLITHADIAPSHVDRDADQIEHVLGPRLVAKLESLAAAEGLAGTVPPSPH